MEDNSIENKEKNQIIQNNNQEEQVPSDYYNQKYENKNIVEIASNSYDDEIKGKTYIINNSNNNLQYSNVQTNENSDNSIPIDNSNDITQDEIDYNTRPYNNELNDISDNNRNKNFEETEAKDLKLKPGSFGFCKSVGRTTFYFIDRYGNPLLIVGPHWPMYFCVVTIISLLMLSLYLKFWSKYSLFIKILGGTIFWTFFISYSFTSLINPGYPRNSLGRTFGIPRKNYYFCDECRFWIRKGSCSTHCFECNICIEGFDHHCPWTGHCIGKNNKITFYIFLLSILAIIIFLPLGFILGCTFK